VADTLAVFLDAGSRLLAPLKLANVLIGALFALGSRGPKTSLLSKSSMRALVLEAGALEVRCGAASHQK
jgi:hypothetical protein